jgi:hypothetical protein
MSGMTADQLQRARAKLRHLHTNKQPGTSDGMKMPEKSGVPATAQTWWWNLPHFQKYKH